MNAYDLKARPRWALASLSLHEAAPGHHFQISLQRELTDLPMFRRFSSDTAYIEGWGLYAEYLGYEMGIYKDPVARFGALDAELWRAIRLVTDTGIHFKGWTRQQTHRLHAGQFAGRADARGVRGRALRGDSRARRWRTRSASSRSSSCASAPKRRWARNSSVAEFHDEVLKDGAIPLEVLEAKIDRWIAAQR